MFRRLFRLSLAFLLSILCVLGVYAPAFRVRINGRWRVTLDDKDLVGAAGSGFTTPYESTANQVTITVSNSSTTWTCYIKKSDTNWTSGLPLYARRTGAGATSYQLITDSDEIFFTDSGAQSNIPVQFRLDLNLQNLSVDDYATTVTYTVIED